MGVSRAKVIERWKQVVRVLEGLSPHEKRKHFDMSKWGQQTDCGTVACAAGHCSRDPWFRQRGFVAELDPAFFNPMHLILYPTRDRDWPDMIEQFFGVPRDPDVSYYEPDTESLEYEGVSIFYDDTVRPVSQVIREIKAFIRKLEKAS